MLSSMFLHARFEKARLGTTVLHKSKPGPPWIALTLGLPWATVLSGSLWQARQSLALLIWSRRDTSTICTCIRNTKAAVLPPRCSLASRPRLAARTL